MNHFPPGWQRIQKKEMANPQAESLFKKYFGAAWRDSEIVGFIVGPSEDNKMGGIVFYRADGSTVKVAFNLNLLMDFAGCLAVLYQHTEDVRTLEGQPAGRA